MSIEGGVGWDGEPVAVVVARGIPGQAMVSSLRRGVLSSQLDDEDEGWDTRDGVVAVVAGRMEGLEAESNETGEDEDRG